MDYAIKAYAIVCVVLIGLGFIGMLACVLFNKPQLPIARYGFVLVPAGIIMVLMAAVVAIVGVVVRA